MSKSNLNPMAGYDYTNNSRYNFKGKSASGQPSGGNAMGGGLVETTYDELVKLRDGGKLVPGCYYRITDYETIIDPTLETYNDNTDALGEKPIVLDGNIGIIGGNSNGDGVGKVNDSDLFSGLVPSSGDSNDNDYLSIPNFDVAGHKFDIVVMALTNDTLSENASAIQSDNDTDVRYISFDFVITEDIWKDLTLDCSPWIPDEQPSEESPYDEIVAPAEDLTQQEDNGENNEQKPVWFWRIPTLGYWFYSFVEKPTKKQLFSDNENSPRDGSGLTFQEWFDNLSESEKNVHILMKRCESSSDNFQGFGEYYFTTKIKASILGNNMYMQDRTGDHYVKSLKNITLDGLYYYENGIDPEPPCEPDEPLSRYKKYIKNFTTMGYFAFSNLNAWKLKYCLDNSKCRFDWVSDKEVEEDIHHEGEIVSVTDNNNNVWDVEYYNTYNCENPTREVVEYKLTRRNDGSIIYSTSKINSTTVMLSYDTTSFYCEKKQSGILTLYIESVEYDEGYDEHISIHKSKGVIYYMEDEFGNRAGFDFKNIGTIEDGEDFRYVFSGNLNGEFPDYSLNNNGVINCIDNELLVQGMSLLNRFAQIGFKSGTYNFTNNTIIPYTESPVITGSLDPVSNCVNNENGFVSKYTFNSMVEHSELCIGGICDKVKKETKW